MKKIFHLIYDLDVGGTENYLLRILPRLTNDFQNYVICFTGPGEIGQKIAEQKIAVFCLNYKNPAQLGIVFWRFRKLVKKLHPEIISTYLPIADIFGRLAGKLLKIPVVISNIRSTHREKKYRKVILLDFLTSRLVDKYTVNSPAIIDYYRSKYPFAKNKFVYIPNGLDIQEFLDHPDPEPIKKQLGIPPINTVIACVANLNPNKGQGYLLAAFEALYVKQPNINLLIIGQGSQKNELLKQTDKYSSKNQILFLGFRQDIKKLLSITDIFVLPTLFEGMSNALLEAMASGCCCVASDIAENRELIENKKSGVLVPPQNDSEIARTIEELIKSPAMRKNLGEAARNKVKDSFAINQVVQKIKTLYEIF